MTEIKVPPFGESITECTVAKWLKADGEQVAKGEAVVAIDTEKASSDLEAPASGILHIAVAEGSDVPIGAVIGSVEAQATPGAQPETVPVAVAGGPTSATRQSAEPVEERTKSDLAHQVGAPTPALPAAGKAQRTEPTDQPGRSSAAAGDSITSARTSTDEANGRRETRRPMSRMRRTIAQHLLKARNETAMLTTFTEVDMSAVLSLRERFQESFQRAHNVKLGFMSFFIKAAVEALQAFPNVNSGIDGDDVVEHHFHDIGVAVSTERGLVVPIIRDADQKSFGEIETELGAVAARAREGKMALDELKGGTFTITNGGVFGSLLSTPLVNPPQVAILGMHTIQERPVAINGEIVIRPMMYLALSYDHRLIDGKEAVQFLTRVRDHIAAPERLLLGL